jgi:hypothetical protein
MKELLEMVFSIQSNWRLYNEDQHGKLVVSQLPSNEDIAPKQKNLQVITSKDMEDFTGICAVQRSMKLLQLSVAISSKSPINPIINSNHV